jgi:uncharacterized protein YndB with AHSA1/START domain
MATNVTEQTVQTFEIVKEEVIAAPIGIVFETILEQMGPYNETPDGRSLQMKLEAWPGGRLFRDLGNDTGHLWGHVQAIKSPTLLEIYGPLFMSTPATSNLQYRLTEEDGLTRVRFVHRSMGWMPADVGGVNEGWTYMMTSIRERAERKAGSTAG